MAITDPQRRVPLSQTGTTLIEILVTVAVTSIGLLGVAGSMVLSAQVNHRAYLQTQANFIAQALIDSMHVNAPAVAAGQYDGNLAADSTRSSACWTSACSPTERASYDRSRFSQALNITLPRASAAMKCAAEGAAGNAETRHSGLCRLEVGWSERPPGQGAPDKPQTLVWIFAP